jgi:hypothetical protein
MNTKFTILSVIATLFLPQLAQADPRADVQLFVSGERLAFDSTGHEKAKGVRVKIFYPKTWKAREVDRPNIIQKLVSNTGTGSAMVSVQSILLPEVKVELTRDEKKEMVAEEFMKMFVPTDAKLVSYKLTALDGEPCGMIEVSQIADRAGLKLAIFMTIYVVPMKGAALSISASFGGNAADGVEAVETRYREVKPILQLIASSCVFLDKWEKK